MCFVGFLKIGLAQPMTGMGAKLPRPETVQHVDSRWYGSLGAD
jgi:hypothetical protein